MRQRVWLALLHLPAVTRLMHAAALVVGCEMFMQGVAVLHQPDINHIICSGVRCRCAQCEKLCDKLQRCSACQLVGYCSRSCQVKHWKAGHKQACKEPQAPAHREQ